MNGSRKTLVPILACLLAVPAMGLAESHDDPRTRSDMRSGHVHHDDDDEFDRTGPYFGFDALFGVDNFDLPDQNPTGLTLLDTEVEHGWGGGGRVGYRFHEYLAAELQGQLNGVFTVDGETTVGRVPLGDVKIATGTANLKFFPLPHSRVQPYLLGGVGMMWGDTSDESAGASLPSNNYEFVGRTGLGLDVYVFPELSVTLEGTYLLPAGTLDDYQHAAALVGVQWHFADGRDHD